MPEAAHRVTRLDSSLLQAVLSRSMARAAAEATRVALHRRCRQLCVHDSSAAIAGVANPPHIACRDPTAWCCKPCLSPSIAVASGDAACVALRRRRSLLCALNSSAARLLAMPECRSMRDEAQQLVVAGGALAVVARASAEATHVNLRRRRWQLYVHDAAAAMVGIASLLLVA